MSKFTTFAAVLVVILLGVIPGTLSAQSTADTVYIPAAQALEISDIINADTAVTDYRVYVLDRGGIYYIENAFEINSSCTFMATGDENARPPVLAPAIRADGSSEEWFFKLIEDGISVDLNDLYLLSMRSDGQTLGWSRGVHIGASNSSVKIRRVVFDAFTEVAIRVDGAQFVKLDVQDSHFRNLLHSTSYFGGQAFLTNGAADNPDTTKFINNTFFAVNSYLFDTRGLGPEYVFEHNTVVLGTVNPFLIRQAENFYLDNNLFYAAHAWGGDPEQTIGGWFFNYPDSVSTSIYRIRNEGVYNGYEMTGPEAFNNEDLGLIFDPSQWTHVARNNAYHFPEALVNFYDAWNDTVTVSDSVSVLSGDRLFLLRELNKPRWINDLGLWVLDNVTDPDSPDYSPNVVHENNIDADPGFVDTDAIGHLGELIAYINRIASRTLDNPWHYELNFPPTWPIPENLAYTNAALMTASTGGFPVGDLNWFPDKKAEWEQGSVTSVERNDDLVPESYSLSHAYPNPFNPQTQIDFRISHSSQVRLTVYNILGQQVKVLVNDELTPGSYTVTWDGTNNAGLSVPSGTYLYRLEAGSFSQTKKVVLLK